MKFPNLSRLSRFPGRAATFGVRAFGQRHGRIRSLGFRFGGLAYSPDVDALDEEAFAALEGLDCWIVDALRPRRIPAMPIWAAPWNGSPGSSPGAPS